MLVNASTCLETALAVKLSSVNGTELARWFGLTKVSSIGSYIEVSNRPF